jgi:hypothetical protein
LYPRIFPHTANQEDIPFVDASRELLPDVQRHFPSYLAKKSALLITLITYLKLAETEIFGNTSTVINDLYESRYKPIFSQLPQQEDFVCPPLIGTVNTSSPYRL